MDLTVVERSLVKVTDTAVPVLTAPRASALECPIGFGNRLVAPSVQMHKRHPIRTAGILPVDAMSVRTVH